MVGLLVGPDASNHPDLESAHIRVIPGSIRGACTQTRSTACLHGTFVAGILCAKRGSDAPAICPNCALLVRPIFAETQVGRLHMPGATPEEIAAAILDSIRAGAHVLNLSVALVQPSSTGQREVEEALHHAASSGAMVFATAGTQGAAGHSDI